jgi:hypothetical protein
VKRALLFVIAALFCAPVSAQSSLFQPIFDVLTHPRCLNCHTRTEFPRQGDERRRHDQLVMRGGENHGAPTLQCSACHQDRNVEDGAVPGAPHWALAPLSMAWEDLTPAQLCETLKDQSRNGNRDLEALFTHMAEDGLVLWGWSPGGTRTTPPLDHPAFVAALRAWIDGGAPCN